METLRDFTMDIAAQRKASAFIDHVMNCGAELSIDRLSAYRKATSTALTYATEEELLASSREYVQLLQRLTTLGQMGSATLPAAPYTTVVAIDDIPEVTWTPVGSPAPVVTPTLTPFHTERHGFRTIVGFDRKLFETADPRGRQAVERRMSRMLRKAQDRALVSSDAAVTGQRPAGLLNGVSSSAAGSPSSLTEDLHQLWSDVSAGDPDAPFFITSPRAALYLATLRVGDSPLFPDAKVRGGNIAGVPLLTSSAAANLLILVDAAHLSVTDDGLVVERGESASVIMADNPSAGPANLVSGFQTNTVFLRFHRFISWNLLSDTAVGFIELADLSGSPS